MGKRVVGEECPALDGTADTGELLIHHSSRAEVEMPHLGVAHLFRRQAHVGPGTADQEMGVVLPQTIPYRCFGVENGVGLAAFAVSPAVKDD